MRRFAQTVLVMMFTLVGCVGTPIEFGVLKFEGNNGTVLNGWYTISPATSSTKTEKKRLRIQFFARDQPKLTTIFDQTYSFLADSTNLYRIYSRETMTVEVKVLNRDGAVAFKKQFHLVGGMPCEVNQ